MSTPLEHWAPIVRNMARKPLIEALQDGPQSIRPRSLHSLTRDELRHEVIRGLVAGGITADALADALAKVQNKGDVIYFKRVHA